MNKNYSTKYTTTNISTSYCTLHILLKLIFKLQSENTRLKHKLYKLDVDNAN